MTVKSQFARFGTDRGGIVEITLRPARFGKDGEQSIVILTPTGEEFKYDHPKDVSEFLKMSISHLLGTLDNLVDEANARVQEQTQRKRGNGRRHLELI